MPYPPIRLGEPTKATYYQKAMGAGQPIVQRGIGREGRGSTSVITDVSVDQRQLGLNDLYEIIDSRVTERRSQGPVLETAAGLTTVFGKHTLYTLVRASLEIHSSVSIGLARLADIMDLARKAHAATQDWGNQSPETLRPITRSVAREGRHLANAETSRRVHSGEKLVKTASFKTRGRSGRPQLNPSATAATLLMIERLLSEQYRIDNRSLNLNVVRRSDSYQLLAAVEGHVDQIINATRLPMTEARKRQIHDHARAILFKPYHFPYFYLANLVRDGEMRTLVDGRQVEWREAVYRAYAAERQLAIWDIALSTIKRNWRLLRGYETSEIRSSLPIDGFDTPQAAIGLRVYGVFREMMQYSRTTPPRQVKQREVTKLAEKAQLVMRDRIFYTERRKRYQHPFAEVWLPCEVRTALIGEQGQFALQ